MGDELVELVGAGNRRQLPRRKPRRRNLDEHATWATRPRGVPVWIDRRYVEADLKIATGLIEPHLMAGFSGGRKLICPGIAALETVQVLARAAFLEHPNADCGILEGNPVHEENTRIARMAGCDFIVNVSLDNASPRHFARGRRHGSGLRGRRRVRRVGGARQPFPSRATWWSPSSAGYPLDTTFYQAVKGLTGVLPIVKQGGHDHDGGQPHRRHRQPGIPEPVLPRTPISKPSCERILGKDYFVLDQWQLEKLAHVARKARPRFVTKGLSPEILSKLYVDSAPSVEQAVAEAMAEYGPNARVAVVPKGPYVMPVVAA